MIVNRVLPWSTSVRSGIEEGDIIWGVNGQFLGSDLLKLSQLLDNNIERKVEVDLYRNGTPLKAKTYVREINQ
jgi:S1-C subfamily serine protease